MESLSCSTTALQDFNAEESTGQLKGLKTFGWAVVTTGCAEK